MSEPLKGTAIVTGASRGIGRATAIRLARNGFAVAVNYVGQQAKADEVVSEIKAAGGRAVAIQANVSKSADARRLFEEAAKQLGPVTVLVNSAGVMAMATIADADDETFDRMMTVNVRGTFNTMREAARALPNGGRVINVSSSVVGMKLPAYGPYTATKAAVEVLTRIMAEEMRGRGITVNAVAPGLIDTPMVAGAMVSAEIRERAVAGAPVRRIGIPDDIAAAVAYLVSEEASFVTGQVLSPNGGRYM